MASCLLIVMARLCQRRIISEEPGVVTSLFLHPPYAGYSARHGDPLTSCLAHLSILRNSHNTHNHSLS